MNQKRVKMYSSKYVLPYLYSSLLNTFSFSYKLLSIMQLYQFVTVRKALSHACLNAFSGSLYSSAAVSNDWLLFLPMHGNPHEHVYRVIRSAVIWAGAVVKRSRFFCIGTFVQNWRLATNNKVSHTSAVFKKY